MNKYRNIRTEVDGINFASKAEASRYQELKLLERADQIRSLELQPKFIFIINGKPLTYDTGHKITYTADFRYQERVLDTWETVVEDKKGYLTQPTRIRLALMKAVNGIEVLIT